MSTALIGQHPYLLGILTGIITTLALSIMVVGLVCQDMKRLRWRLNEIIRFARQQDREWTRRRMTGDDWNELVLIIQPYEEA